MARVSVRRGRPVLVALLLLFTFLALRLWNNTTLPSFFTFNQVGPLNLTVYYKHWGQDPDDPEEDSFRVSLGGAGWSWGCEKVLRLPRVGW